MRPIILVGDSTDHGGVVLDGSPSTDVFGKKVARIGDPVSCPKRNHGNSVIVSGDATMLVDGIPVARHGDKCACGAALISSQMTDGTE